MYPGLVEYGLELAGFAKPLIGSQVATSAGRKNFDNVVIDSEAQDRFLVSPGVLELPSLKNMRTGTEGASDHAPVYISIREAPRVG